MNIIDDIKNAFKTANIVEKIIYINVGLFLITLFTKPFVTNWLALKGNLDVLITQPWTLLTYGFFHGNFIHLFFNLVFLYYIGNLFLSFFTKKQFLNYFILGILAGGIAYLLIKPMGVLVGASAGIMAVLIGLATKIPNYELRLNLIGGVKLWVIALIYILISFAGMDGENSGGNIAHLGGALIGFIYTKQLQKGLDIGKFIENIIDWISNLFKSKPRQPMRTVYKKKNINRTPTRKETTSKQKQIDTILEKISKSGYESLSKEEKDFLFKAGKN
ncbi:rhomboid family protein [Urechidicola croceus]|uniref:Uncharacterized protein n=1 Tax=Urechidicola croceus TaxID=1850246 RepID=A0A1D8P5Z7_9FLAO|nr:rhomboid family intramembrane serine protease [Urechidicola croceus]AOW19979.1 hypothetical protein LPB138_04450 [Urechidicola croceus]